MGTERVDKQWSNKGLTGYSTEAILGTLSHYGVPLDEAGFKASAEGKFPIELAEGWASTWKGVGPFQRFPVAAADELFRRLTGQLSPAEVAEKVVVLMSALSDPKSEAAYLEDAFSAAQRLVPKLPADKQVRDRFSAEVVTFLSGVLDAFDGLAVKLAQRGKLAEAERFAQLEESLFPVRKGLATALVSLAKGDAEAGLAALEAIANDTTRDAHSRLMGADALFHHGASARALAPLNALIDEAEADGDFDFTYELVHRLRHLVGHLPPSTDRDRLRDRTLKLVALAETKLSAQKGG
jgi:hypothetical protein